MLITDGRHSFAIGSYKNPTALANAFVPFQVGLNAGDQRRYVNIPVTSLLEENIIRIDGMHAIELHHTSWDINLA